MEEDYFSKMSDEVYMDIDKNMDDTVTNEDCSKFLQLQR